MTLPAPFVICPKCRKAVVPAGGRLPEHLRYRDGGESETVPCEGGGKTLLGAWLTAQVDHDEARANAIDHAVRQARALREVAFKRELIQRADEQGVSEGRDPDERERDEAMLWLLTDLLMHLAEVYAGRPGFAEAVAEAARDHD